MREHTSFGYRLSKTADGWTWTTFDLAGKVAMRGHAPSKAVAAACIIRALARASAPVADAA
jgi:hypothetical protein